MAQEIYGLPPPEAPDPDQPPAATVAMIGGLVFAALVFVIVGVGFVVGWWGPNADVDEPEPEPTAKVAVEQPAEPEQPELAGAELMPTVQDRPAAVALEETDPFAGAEPVPEIAPAGKSRGGAGATGSGADTSAGAGDGSGQARPARVRVAFVIAQHYERVELKLGGKVVKLTGDRTLDVPPGGYRVELRKGPEDAWAPAGLITLELGTRYRVTLLDPPLAKLEALK